MPTESAIELWPNVPVCVLNTDPLDDLSLPDLSMIDDNMLKFHVDDTHDNINSVSCTMHKLFPFDTKFFPQPDSMTDSTITCDAADVDSVGNTSVATLEVDKVFDDDIMNPRLFPKMKHMQPFARLTP